MPDDIDWRARAEQLWKGVVAPRVGTIGADLIEGALRGAAAEVEAKNAALFESLNLTGAKVSALEARLRMQDDMTATLLLDLRAAEADLVEKCVRAVAADERCAVAEAKVSALEKLLRGELPEPPPPAPHDCGGLCPDFHCVICGQPGTQGRPCSTIGMPMHADCRATVVPSESPAPPGSDNRAIRALSSAPASIPDAEGKHGPDRCSDPKCRACSSPQGGDIAEGDRSVGAPPTKKEE